MSRATSGRSPRVRRWSPKSRSLCRAKGLGLSFGEVRRREQETALSESLRRPRRRDTRRDFSSLLSLRHNGLPTRFGRSAPSSSVSSHGTACGIGTDDDQRISQHLVLGADGLVRHGIPNPGSTSRDVSFIHQPRGFADAKRIHHPHSTHAPAASGPSRHHLRSRRGSSPRVDEYAAAGESWRIWPGSSGAVVDWDSSSPRP